MNLVVWCVGLVIAGCVGWTLALRFRAPAVLLASVALAIAATLAARVMDWSYGAQAGFVLVILATLQGAYLGALISRR